MRHTRAESEPMLTISIGIFTLKDTNTRMKQFNLSAKTQKLLEFLNLLIVLFLELTLLSAWIRA